MKIADALCGVTHLFLDTAPVIYYVENNPAYSTVIYVRTGDALRRFSSLRS